MYQLAQVWLLTNKSFCFKINDVALAQANTDIMEGYLNKAKHAIEVEQDVYLLGKHVDVEANNTIGGTAAVSLTSANVYTQFVKLAQILKNSSAITDGQNLGLLSPELLNDVVTSINSIYFVLSNC